MSEPLTEAILMETVRDLQETLGDPMPTKLMMSKPTSTMIKRWNLLFFGIPLRIGKHRVTVRQRNTRWQVVPQ